MANEVEVQVPDIGDFKNVPVIEVLVRAGDTVAQDAPLIVIETDKATMEVPASAGGVVQSLLLKVGDRVNRGDRILILVQDSVSSPAPVSAPTTGAVFYPPASAADTPAPAGHQGVADSASREPAAAEPPRGPAPIRETFSVESKAASVIALAGGTALLPPASPMVRKLARELGVDLSAVGGTGARGRILREDVERHVREQLARPQGLPGVSMAGGGPFANLLAWPTIDFAKFGAIERQPLVRLRKISGANLSRNWVTIPHVTNFDEADITELEAFRQQTNREQAADAPKLTLLCFLIKACVEVLRRFPEYNASLDGDELVLKRYFHIGFAADTPNGLVVPVIRDADQKGLRQIAKEASELAALARGGKLKPEHMQGGCFSISSLGGIGGTGFTPIINAPEVAILGVTKAELKPKWNGQAFQPRLIVPLNLSWDHRVVDGASAARFLVALGSLLSDFRRVCL